MKVRYNRGALADIDEILTYIGERNPKAAAELLARFERTAELIGRAPEIGTLTQRANLRKLVVGSYLMVYEIVASEAVIHYIRHGARRRPWLGEE